MRYMKIGAFSIPTELSSRSRWAVGMLDDSVRLGLAPIPVPETPITRFTVCVPDAVAHVLQAHCEATGQSLAQMRPC
jgi:hypothetical protein